MKVLVTGGTGYIGSHTCVELLNATSYYSNQEKKVVEDMCKDAYNF